MDCSEAATMLDELALDVLPGDRRTALLNHLEECPGCRQLLDELSETADALLLAGPVAAPPPGFEDRVLERIQAPRARAQTRLRLFAAAAAAALLLALQPAPRDPLFQLAAKPPLAEEDESHRRIALDHDRRGVDEVGETLLMAEPPRRGEGPRPGPGRMRGGAAERCGHEHAGTRQRQNGREGHRQPWQAEPPDDRRHRPAPMM